MMSLIVLNFIVHRFLDDVMSGTLYSVADKVCERRHHLNEVL